MKITYVWFAALFVGAVVFAIMAIATTSRNLAASNGDVWYEPVATEAEFRDEISSILKEEGGNLWTLSNLEKSLDRIGVRYRTPAEWRRDVLLDSVLTYGDDPTFWTDTEAEAWVQDVRRELSALGIQRIHGWKVTPYKDGD